jgi:prepilin-type N-terminal cleavage/methylation domain-containing protein
MKKMNKKAFTLIELLIVIAIIGILFIVLVSKVDFATDKAKATGVQTDFRSFQVAFETVARESAGFNTFGWDEGDNAGGVDTKGGAITINEKSYTYTNAYKDCGDRVRNSYDEGDMNLDGILQSDETWTGRKIYTETWTSVYTLENPAEGKTDFVHKDDNAVILLETAINKNLDPKLHITIHDPVDDGATQDGYVADTGFDVGRVYHITMKNQAVDPWKTEYVGKYLTNASMDSTTNSQDANKAMDYKDDVAGQVPDAVPANMDRGAIIIYSKGANLELGSQEEIIGGEVVVTVSMRDDEKTDNNVAGQDDYSISTIYTYKNGYGEIITSTTGWSNNQ